MAREDGSQFVRWREEFVSQERGSRVVHYYLEDAAGVSHLAVVGTERSLRHMLYVVSEDFSAAWGCGGGADDGAAPPVFARKWRSRREVVDWLASFLPVKALDSKFSKYGSFADNDSGLDGYGETNSFLHQNLGKDCSSDITWSGSFWTCGKQLRHYRAFCRNGTTISTHTFVLVLSEEENRYLAYLEDMYEDKKGQKKIKVRWFHQNQEFACAIPPPPPHPCEVFITPFTQVISVECVDDIATVLTPDHYEKCSNAMPTSSLAGIRFCFRQYSKNKFKHFDLRSLRGYFSQAVVLSLKIPAESEKDGEYCTPGKQLERLYSKCLGTKICRSPQADSIPSYQILSNEQPPGKHLSINFIVPQNKLMPTYNTGDRLEILSQDSGIIGCWFRCTVLKSCTNHNKLKVQYDDLQNADDSGRLEEMVPASALALPDKLGLRCQDRLRIRPRPQENSSVDGAALLPGTAVDVWQFSGWWEGVVVSLDNIVADSLQVYFPGENFFRPCQLRNVRISKDWVKNRWVDIETKSDVLSQIPSDSVRTKQADNAPPIGVIDSSSSAMPEQELAATQANSHGDKPVPKQELAATQANSNGEKPVPEQELPATQANSNGDKPVPKQELAASQANSDGDKPVPEQEFAATQANSNGDKPASEQELAATQANSNGDKPVPEKELAATQANSNGDKPVPEKELAATQANSSGDKPVPKQELAATQPNSNGVKPVPEQKLAGTQASSNGNNKQTEGSRQSEVSMTDEASGLVEDDKRTILGKRPRDDSMTDEASAFVEDDKRTILGKRPRDDNDAEQKCNGEVGVDVSKTCLGSPNSLDSCT
ncbi:uncharacterized protein [Miscanthus floridulus]|uniref:uncharacterized protein n=1 Tax=Miscanthus floridulus TaxID=154761 RepID=UPI0034577FB6